MLILFVVQPDHDPNTQHVLCGADADLIMLGLATHEPNFTIIREEFKPNKPRPCDVCGQLGKEHNLITVFKSRKQNLKNWEHFLKLKIRGDGQNGRE